MKELLATSTPDSPRAWIVVLAAFIAGFVVFGITYSFGVFLEPMVAEFEASRAATSGLFSVTGLAFYMLGPVTGHLSDRFGPRNVVGAGAVIMGAGLILTGFIDRVWVGYITYGIGVGVGSACSHVPTLASIGGWFVKRRNAALGLAAAGTGCGMLIVPPLAAALIESFGWRYATIVLGIGSAVLLALCTAMVAPAPLANDPVPKRPFRRTLGSFEFLALYVSWVLATTALFVPFVFLPAFAMEQGADQVSASALLSVLGGMSILGRVGIGTLSKWTGTLALFKAAVFVMAASYILWLVLPGYWWLVMFSVILGFGYGVRISLVPSVLIAFFGLQNLGALLGVFFTATGIAAVLGPMLAGMVVDATGSYQWGIAFALAAGVLGFAAIAPLKAARPG